MDTQKIPPADLGPATIPTGTPLPTACAYHSGNTVVAITSTRRGLCETCATCSTLVLDSRCTDRARLWSARDRRGYCLATVELGLDLGATVPLVWLDEVPDAVRTRAGCRNLGPEIGPGKQRWCPEHLAYHFPDSETSDPAPPAPQVPPIPNEVRAAGWTALLAARDSGVELSQAYGQVVEALALPLYLAWLGGRELVELPEPDSQAPNGNYLLWSDGAEDEQAVTLSLSPDGWMVDTSMERHTLDEAETRALRTLAAVALGRSKAGA